MIKYPMVWIIFPIALVILIVASWLLAKSDRLENKLLRSGFTAVGAIIGFFAFALPFFEQPSFHNTVLNYVIGVPLAVFGLIGRVYPMIYLRKRGTSTTLNEVTRIVDTGPYGIVRHPQYAGGILFGIGWFLIWGAIYCLYLVPLFVLLAIVQAFIEEKHILEKEFGDEYREYKKKVGMFFPKIRRRK
ncbi:MAG: isoprenylcysteine carboxylmethyltransferase family protein [Candidatus Verstraetearchaeota archaeon]|nr:isoprenylcysteine carboxylmethyltransferase family protein [Candidatus Verstraetearchaeota archaeon]